jgi:hypothetical protein
MVEASKILDEQRFGRCRIVLASAVSHRLPAARLIQRISDLHAQALEQLEVAIPTSGKKAST